MIFCDYLLKNNCCFQLLQLQIHIVFHLPFWPRQMPTNRVLLLFWVVCLFDFSFSFFVERGFNIVCHHFMNRGGSNFVDGIDVALLCIIQISFCYINITFIFQTFNSLATWVFTHTTVMSNVRYWPIALVSFVFCFGQEWINHKLIRR